jgi:putative membrane-bound dehydrogenase-like protein
MKSTIALVLALPALAAAAPSPVRVLFLGDGQAPSRDHCHIVMREMGRDAVWFDYASDPAKIGPETLSRFDAVLVEGAADRFPALASFDKTKLVPEPFAADAGSPAFLTALQEKLLTAAGPSRRAEWQAFLAQREPEIRQENANIANYEKRPKPLTLQLPLSVKGSMERTQVAPDLRLELFAAEPDITKPIAMAWDDHGRCWVAETSDYPHGVAPDGQGNDRIKICEDTNGDGKADKFTVFADHLNIPTSLTFANGGIIVSQPPRLLFLKDTNNDDKADVRQDIITGWGIGDTHAQANNLHYGIDNWFYGCVGYSAFDGEVGGQRKKFTQGTYRFKADGSALEFLHQFSNNSWGQSANDAGDQYGGTANGAPIFYGGIPASLVPPGQRVMTARKINTEEKVHTITPNFRQVDVMGGYTAAAGSSFIYSDKLPARLQGMAMVCEPTMKTIALMDVKSEGAGANAGDGFNLVASTDEWMSPVFAEVGPDGAVWFADWQNYIIQHNPTPTEQRGGYTAETGIGGAHKNDLRDHSRGRIYRVTWKQAADPNKVMYLDEPLTQLAALKSDNLERRLQAQRLIIDGKRIDKLSDSLKSMVKKSEGHVAALHALWILHAWNTLDDATFTAALYAKDARLRRNAIRALGNDPASIARYFGAGVVNDPDPTTRLAAFVKLAEVPTTPEIQTLAKQLALNPAVKADEWLTDAARLLTKKHRAENWTEGPNLLPNPSFETTGPDGLPEGWKRRDYNADPGTTGAKWSTIELSGWTHDGNKSIRCITTDNSDTSLYTEVTLKPDTEYRLSAWIKTNNFRGKASLNDHRNRHETEKVTRTSDWAMVETTWNTGTSGNLQTTINLLHVAKGDSHFDDVKLTELTSATASETLTAGDAARGQEIFWKHPVAGCVNCHMLGGKGSPVGPPLDGIATRKDAAYIAESLLEPNAKLAETYTATPVSPMPPMGLILKPQELEDIKAFLMTLK